MIDLVHPSLYCYVKGMTVVRDAVSSDIKETLPTSTTSSTSTTIPLAASISTSTAPSIAASLVTSTSTPPSLPSTIPVTDAIFQWLPSEFKIDDSDDEVVTQ